MNFSINDFFSKCDQLGTLVTLSKKSIMENFILCVVEVANVIFQLGAFKVLIAVDF